MANPHPHGIFLSYRRQDSAFPAGWLYQQLADRFGPSYVFKDVDSIRPGEDFVEAITAAIRTCHTMLVVIGPRWLAESGGRPDRPVDVVRFEIETALAHGLRIIPVLVLDAAMPTAGQLPPSIAVLARRNAVEITSSHFQADLARLVQGIDQRPGPAEVGAPQPVQPAPPQHRLRPAIPLIALAVLLSLGLLGVVAYQQLGARSTPGGVTVPVVVGLSPPDAVSALGAAGLTVGEQTPVDVDQGSQVGTVVRSEPPAGATADRQGAVALFIGTQPTTVAVPEVVGQDFDTARRTLESAGFTVNRTEVDDGGDDGAVVGTDPSAGSPAKPGSKITIRVSSGDSGRQPVPLVIGLRTSDAARKLSAAGFQRVVTRSKQVSDPAQDGVVVLQNPGGGVVTDTTEAVQLTAGEFTAEGGGN